MLNLSKVFKNKCFNVTIIQRNCISIEIKWASFCVGNIITVKPYILDLYELTVSVLGDLDYERIKGKWQPFYIYTNSISLQSSQIGRLTKFYEEKLCLVRHSAPIVEQIKKTSGGTLGQDGQWSQIWGSCARTRVVKRWVGVHFL
jgi:hypothetical protein